MIHANWLVRRVRETGCNITVNSLHPGVIETKLLGDLKASLPQFTINGDSVAKGAETSIFLVSSKSVETVTGEYFVNCEVSPMLPLAKDEATQDKMAEISTSLINAVIASKEADGAVAA